MYYLLHLVYLLFFLRVIIKCIAIHIIENICKALVKVYIYEIVSSYSI